MSTYAFMMAVSLIVACSDQKSVSVVRTDLASATKAISFSPLIAKPGETVEVRGENFLSSQEYRAVFTLANGSTKEAKLSVKNKSSASFVMPSGLGLGEKKFIIKSDDTEVGSLAMIVGDGSKEYYSGDPSRVCSTETFFDKFGKTKQGTKDCATGSVANCTADGVVGCVTTASYKSADATVATAANIKSGVTIAGQTGDYPSSTNPLSGADTTADLSDNTATREGQLRSATSFEFFKSDGTRVVAAGDADITVSNVRDTVEIFGITGSYVGTPPDEWDLRAGVTVGTATGKLKTNCRNGASLATFDISMPKAATVNVDDTFTFATAHGWSVGDTVRISYGTVPPATPAINNTTTYYVIVSSATSIRLATSGANATGGTAINITGVGAAVSVFRWGDGLMGTADTIDDYNNNGAVLTQSPWASANFCGGVATTAADANVWLDVTTSGGSASSCSSSPTLCKMKDKISGLEWSKTQSTSMRWGVAMDHCHNLSIDGVTGWRLPTQKELMDAFNHGIRSAASADWITSAQMNSYFWSSSTVSDNPTTAWVVGLAAGSTYDGFDKTDLVQAACVR